MKDGKVSIWDLVIPPDLKEHAEDLYLAVWRESGNLADDVAEVIKKFVEVRGKPEKLDGGVQLLKADVAGAVGAAKFAIEQADASFRGAWTSHGGDAFGNYVLLLTGAMGKVQVSANGAADAIAAFRSALQALWIEIINATYKAGVDVLNAVSTLGGDKKKGERTAAIAKIVAAFVEFGARLLSELMKLDAEAYKSRDLLRAADAEFQGLKDVQRNPTGRAAMHYTGPTGRQLPMPNNDIVDPNWGAQQIRDYWKPRHDLNTFFKVEGGRGVQIDTHAMQNMINAFRGNGEFWTKAQNKQIEASINHLTPDAFGSIGTEFYADATKLLNQHYILYLHSDTAMETVANLLALVNKEYGAVDAAASRVLLEYLT
jgi:hypothetical protein